MTVRAHGLRLLAAMLLAIAILVVATPERAGAQTPVTQTPGAQPQRMIALLQVQLPRGDVTCTGFMVGPHTVATAAHCLYSKDYGGWATSVFVTPGIDGLNAPFATEYATTFAVSPLWISTQDSVTADYAAITLSSNTLGNATGWFDLALPSDDQLSRGTFSTAGYGTTVQYGTLWQMAQPQPLANFDANFLEYQWGTSTGESGAAIFEPEPTNGRYRAVGVLKGAFGPRTERTEFALRMTTAMLEFYRAQLAKSTSTVVEQVIPTMFTSPLGVAVRVTSPVTRVNAPSVLQSSLDQVVWSTIATEPTDARGVASYTITPTDTRFYRVVVQGIGTGRVGRGYVTGDSVPVAAGRGTFSARPAYSSSRVAFAVFQGGTNAELTAALRGANASAAWVQNMQGDWFLYAVDVGFLNDPFLNDPFLKAFPTGFASATSMTLVAAQAAPASAPTP